MKYLLVNNPISISYNVHCKVTNTYLYKDMLLTKTEMLNLIARYSSHKVKADILQSMIEQGHLTEVNLKPCDIVRARSFFKFLKPSIEITFSNNLIINIKSTNIK